MNQKEIRGKQLVIGLNKENSSHVFIFLGRDLRSAWQAT
jgi:hypothetical protein